MFSHTLFGILISLATFAYAHDSCQEHGTCQEKACCKPAESVNRVNFSQLSESSDKLKDQKVRVKGYLKKEADGWILKGSQGSGCCSDHSMGGPIIHLTEADEDRLSKCSINAAVTVEGILRVSSSDEAVSGFRFWELEDPHVVDDDNPEAFSFNTVMAILVAGATVVGVMAICTRRKCSK